MRFKTGNYFPQCSQKGSPTSHLSFKHVCFACSGRFCIICLFQWATFGLLMSLFLRFFNVCVCFYVLVDLSRAEKPLNAPVAPLHWPHVSDVWSHFDDIVWQEFHVFSWTIESAGCVHCETYRTRLKHAHGHKPACFLNRWTQTCK